MSKSKATYKIHHGDCIEVMRQMPEQSIDLLVTSPPFPSVYAYNDSEADIGNSEDLETEAPIHLSFFFRALMRVMRPGRAAIIHCTQIVRMKRSGYRGMYDFRGMLIRLGQRAGLIYEYDWLVSKNPQSQAIRTKSRSLQFAGLEADRIQSRGAMGDYLIKFLMPGENAAPLKRKDQVTRNDWIKYASAVWDDVQETDTLNTKEARDEKDTRHIAPLQLEVYRRLILLYSDPGETVLDPFAGIGSCGFVALGGRSPKTGRGITDQRNFVGIELKPSYHESAISNCEKAIRQHKEAGRTLFDNLEDDNAQGEGEGLQP